MMGSDVTREYENACKLGIGDALMESQAELDTNASQAGLGASWVVWHTHAGTMLHVFVRDPQFRVCGQGCDWYELVRACAGHSEGEPPALPLEEVRKRARDLVKDSIEKLIGQCHFLAMRDAGTLPAALTDTKSD